VGVSTSSGLRWRSSTAARRVNTPEHETLSPSYSNDLAAEQPGRRVRIFRQRAPRVDVRGLRRPRARALLARRPKTVLTAGEPALPRALRPSTADRRRRSIRRADGRFFLRVVASRSRRENREIVSRWMQPIWSRPTRASSSSCPARARPHGGVRPGPRRSGFIDSFDIGATAAGSPRTTPAPPTSCPSPTSRLPASFRPPAAPSAASVAFYTNDHPFVSSSPRCGARPPAQLPLDVRAFAPARHAPRVPVPRSMARSTPRLSSAEWTQVSLAPWLSVVERFVINRLGNVRRCGPARGACVRQRQATVRTGPGDRVFAARWPSGCALECTASLVRGSRPALHHPGQVSAHGRRVGRPDVEDRPGHALRAALLRTTIRACAKERRGRAHVAAPRLDDLRQAAQGRNLETAAWIASKRDLTPNCDAVVRRDSRTWSALQADPTRETRDVAVAVA